MMFLSILVVALALATQPLCGEGFWMSHYQTLSVGNGAPWGSWAQWHICPPYSFAGGFSLRVQGRQGSGDDTAVNGIRLFCIKGGRFVGMVTSAYGPWGVWKPGVWVHWTRLISFQLKVHPLSSVPADHTAVNDIRFRTTVGTLVSTPYGMPWGTWGGWSKKCHSGGGICGILTKVQSPQGWGDDTALNDVRFACCRFKSFPFPQPPHYYPSSPG